jgi:hypothetical protein
LTIAPKSCCGHVSLLIYLFYNINTHLKPIQHVEGIFIAFNPQPTLQPIPDLECLPNVLGQLVELVLDLSGGHAEDVMVGVGRRVVVDGELGPRHEPFQWDDSGTADRLLCCKHRENSSGIPTTCRQAITEVQLFPHYRAPFIVLRNLHVVK